MRREAYLMSKLLEKIFDAILGQSLARVQERRWEE